MVRHAQRRGIWFGAEAEAGDLHRSLPLAWGELTGEELLTTNGGSARSWDEHVVSHGD
ncbi:hypothetical protein HY251_10100 [bacterium]|nr:hypothetical protein [bacterium]